MKYRIVRHGNYYEVEYRRRWNPFWSTYFWQESGGQLSSCGTLDQAHSRLDRLKRYGPDDHKYYRPEVVHEE